MPQLTDLVVEEVSLVDRPANTSIDPKTGKKTRHAVVALFKRDSSAAASMRAARLQAVRGRLNSIQQGIEDVKKTLAMNRQALAARLAEGKKEESMPTTFEQVLKSAGSRDAIVAAVEKEAEVIAKRDGLTIDRARAKVWNETGAHEAYEAAPIGKPKQPERKVFRCTKAEAELDRIARQRVKKTGRSYAQCCSDVLTERPELYKQYQEELASGRTFLVPEPEFIAGPVLKGDDEGECPKCGEETEDGDKFCSNCGHKLA